MSATAVAAVVIATIAALGCGGSRERVIVRVAGRTISESELNHWASVMAPRQGAPEPPRFTACIAHLRELELRPGSSAQLVEACRREYVELRQSALHSLIVDRWLVGEAADQGTPVSEADVDRRLHEKYASPEGKLEYNSLLSVGGHTASDVRLEVQVELAATRVRERLLAYSLEIPPGQVASYYRHHIRQFRVPEHRDVEVVGNVSEKSRVTSILSDVKRGISFSSVSYHESLERPDFASLVEEKRIFYLAAFGARPDVLVGPLRINGYYFLFEVTHISPARVQSLSEATPAIKHKFSSARRVSFVTRWRRKWIAQTSCAPGYVVQKCRQAHIAVADAAPEDPLEVN